MADVIEVPGIWDYLGKGLQAGIDSYNARKKEQKDTEDKEVGFMTQLLNAGLINQDDFNSAISGTRYKDIKARASKAETSEKIAATGQSPVTGRPATTNELHNAGLLTQGEQLKDQATGAQAQTTVSAEDVKGRYLKGDPISDREAAAIGLQTDENLDLAKVGQNHKILVEKAPGYVDQALSQLIQGNDGRIPTRGWEDVIDQAADQYNQLRVQSGLPADPSAKAYMHSIVLQRLVAQRTLDIDQMRAQNAGLNRLSPVDRMFQAMTGVVESRRKVLDDMTSNNVMLQLKLNNPNAQNDPDVIRYQAVEQQLLNAQNAQAKLAQGIVPSDISKYLQVDPTTAPNTTGQQIVGPGAPAAQVRQDVVKNLVDRINKNPAMQSQLADGLKKGLITQAEFDAITAGISGASQQPAKTDTTPRRMGPR